MRSEGGAECERCVSGAAGFSVLRAERDVPQSAARSLADFLIRGVRLKGSYKICAAPQVPTYPVMFEIAPVKTQAAERSVTCAQRAVVMAGIASAA